MKTPLRFEVICCSTARLKIPTAVILFGEVVAETKTAGGFDGKKKNDIRAVLPLPAS